MNYKTISKIETQYSYPAQEIGVKIDVYVDRDLSKDEQYELRNHCEQIQKLLRKNTLLNDENEQFNIQLEKEQLIACFPSPIYVKEIPNEYNSEAINPWFLVTTPKGVIKIGWRKRVINIDWEGSDIKEWGNEWFANEETTHGNKYVHAYGYDKAKEYIQKLLNS